MQWFQIGLALQWPNPRSKKSKTKLSAAQLFCNPNQKFGPCLWICSVIKSWSTFWKLVNNILHMFKLPSYTFLQRERQCSIIPLWLRIGTIQHGTAILLQKKIHASFPWSLPLWERTILNRHRLCQVEETWIYYGRCFLAEKVSAWAWQGHWNQTIYKVSSKPFQCMILWILLK